MDLHDKSRLIQLRSAFAVYHSDGNNRYKRGPNNVLEHCCHRLEVVRVEAKSVGVASSQNFFPEKKQKQVVTQ